MAINLTAEQRAILADVVVDPNKWIADAIAGKVERHRAAYLQRKEQMGQGYRNRKERDEDDRAVEAERLAALAEAERERVEQAEQAREAERAALVAEIRQQVLQEMDK